MSKRRMVGWQPLAVENPDAPTAAPAPAAPQAAPEPAQTPAPQPEHTPAAEQSAAAAAQAAPVADGPPQDPNVPRRRMAGWQPLTVANTAGPVAPAAAPQASAPAPAAESVAQPADAAEQPAAEPVASGPIQDPNVPRRRMAGWQPLSVARDGAPAAAAPTAAPAAAAQTAAAAETPAVTEQATPAAAQAVPVAPAPVTEDLPRRRMDGWEPLKVGHPDTAEAIAPQPDPASAAEEPTPAPVAETAPAAPRRRMGAPAASQESAPAAEPAVKTPEVVTPEPAKPAAKTEAAPAGASAQKPPKKEMSKVTKVVLTLLGVAVVAAGLVLIAQWVRGLEPVSEFIATYDGTPTHPDGVEPGIPAWVGWQHFFNFFIIVMVIRSGLLIRNQERPEAYWTPNDGGFFSPNKKNSPQKVSIQQWIHQSFNVLWVVNGLIFYIMVFATGHWMRIVPTNWDIFPNIVSAGLQYLSLDWPAENSWVYYNALQIMTYFITVFIAAPIAVLTGLRLSTWWPQKAEGINKVFTLPVARKIHFFTMIYFILFIIVHLFLVFTTGVLHNMNIMFTARDASDWWGIAVFALSVAVTVGVAWLIKPIFISPIAEKTGTVSTR
ncbi:hypothetical protein GCM10023190_17190 [Enteractinococcus fodinae]|uniref:Thiosulfate reductase cytochrome b subunit n=1 Tax=Enteractinococcus fodinae TaxID=684663 RepID=A0ABU2AWU0_9MICC|nr:cytochrome b/b6 domain-containing protein [Enteractinococcus fodinae]MDR7345810.1 thiosulfate reductase cytochrome b subunit [Enteractinococcus fodinae]